MSNVIQLIKQDALRSKALHCVFQLNLPQCYLSAGFVRNLVWDHLHSKQHPTVLNDVDVIYFDPNEHTANRYQAANKHQEYEEQLRCMMPELNWQVRNQALMHVRNGDMPYLSTVDAMSYWPEKETAVGIRQVGANKYECISAFGFDSLFNLQITPNPKRSRDVFEQRIHTKNWLTIWPMLRVVGGPAVSHQEI
ncbi:nucleotidyltransferase family protein [Vibrio sp. E150_011]